MKTVHLYVSGRVQGVFFRHYTQEKARKLDLYGWVRNLADGRVEILAQGEDIAVDELVSWSYNGSP